MTKRILEFTTEIACSSQKLFDFHTRKGAFARLTPYWERVTIDQQSGVLIEEIPKEIKLKIKIGPFASYWHLRHDDLIFGEKFVDYQISGPFFSYKHTHLIKSFVEKSNLIDKLEFELPYGFIGDLFVYPFIKNKLERLFKYRHQTTRFDIYASKINTEKKIMKILISGSSGLVGKDLSAFLEHQGHQVHKLVRNRKQINANSIYWNPETNEIDANVLEGFDAVIHLAGENIADKRWSPEQKQKIRDSRVNSTKLLAGTLAKLKSKPKVFISASAIGFYGDRPNESLSELSPHAKNDYLSETCVDWENSANAAKDSGIRVVHPRFGIILSPKSGALAKLLLPFQIGLGGIIGSGKQIMSWIALDDVIYGLHYLLMNESLSGAVNFTSPNPVSNYEFTKTLGKVLGRPTVFPVPSFMAKVVFGEMADALLLSTARVKPAKLEEAEFKFSHPNLEEALRYLLGK